MALHLCRLDSSHFIRKSSAQNCVHTVSCSKTLLNLIRCSLISGLSWFYATFLSFWKHNKSNSEYLSFKLDSQWTFQMHIQEAGPSHLVVLVAYSVPAHEDLYQDQGLQMNLDLVKVAPLDAICLLQGCSVTQNLLPILVFYLHLDSWEYGLKWTDASWQSSSPCDDRNFTIGTLSK